MYMPPIVLRIAFLITSAQAPELAPESSTSVVYKTVPANPEEPPVPESAPESTSNDVTIVDILKGVETMLVSESTLPQEQGLSKPALVDEALPNDVMPCLSGDGSEMSPITISLVEENVPGDALRQVLGLIPEPILAVDEALPSSMVPTLVERTPGSGHKPLPVTIPMVNETIIEDALQQKSGLVHRLVPATEETTLKDATPGDSFPSPTNASSAVTNPILEVTPESLCNPSSPVVVPSVPADDGSSLEDTAPEHAPHVRRRVRRSVKRERRALREQAAFLASTNNGQIISAIRFNDQQARPFPSDQSTPVAGSSVVRSDLALNTQHRPKSGVSKDVPGLPSIIAALIVDRIPENALQQAAGPITGPVLAVDEAVPEDVTSINPGDVSTLVDKYLSENGHAHTPPRPPRRRIRRSVQRERRALREEAQCLAGVTTVHPSPRTSYSWHSARQVQAGLHL